MLIVLVSLSILGVLTSQIFNWTITSRQVLSYSLAWLVLGAVIFSFLRRKIRNIIWGITTTILLFCFITINFFLFYIFFELRLIPILLIIIFIGNQPERLSARVYFLIYTSIFSIPYLIILIKINFTRLLFYHNIISCSRLCLVMLIPFLVKIPVIGLHFWLPKAHVEASTSGSIILAGVLLKLGRYGIYRVASILILFTFSITSLFWIVLATISRVLTFIQTDIKKLVAYSRVTHITFLIISLCVNNKLILFNRLIMSLSHGWVRIGIFLYSGAIANSYRSRLSLLLRRESKFHWFTLLIGLMLVINAALPPFPSFFTELLSLNALASMTPRIWIFVLYRRFVCYYNVYLWICVSHYNSKESFYSSPFKEGTLQYVLFCFRVSRLIWIMIL